MVNYCLDTNVVIAIIRGDLQLKNKLENLKTSQDFFVSTIALCELYKGAYLSNEIQKNLDIIKEFCEEINLLTLNEESCQEFGKQFQLLQKKGKLTQEMDLMIAAICIINNATLITRNKKHYEHLPVHLEVW